MKTNKLMWPSILLCVTAVASSSEPGEDVADAEAVVKSLGGAAFRIYSLEHGHPRALHVILSGPGFTDEDVKRLSRLDAIEALSIYSGRITVDSALSICDMRGLKKLKLTGRHIDAQFLSSLEKSKTLVAVILLHTSVNRTDVEKFQSRNPRFDVTVKD